MYTSPLNQLGPLTVAEFLRSYWQQRAVYLPQVLPDFTSPLTAEELAGLALEEDIESRLITHTAAAPWQLENGPFDEERFHSLPESDWTLLVQAVDQLVPEVHALLQQFRFLPSWRLDDVMVSYAPTGGSVGPHFDYYDVFLLQGAGTREWKIGQACDSFSDTLDGTPLKILKNFEPQQTFICKPGDILYIPPGVAHWGTAQDNECITYSIGFRAPSVADILCDFSQEVASTLTNDQRYRDSQSENFFKPGEISTATVQHLRDIINEQLTDESLARWFGRYMSQPKYPEQQHIEHTGDASPLSNNDLVELLAQDPVVYQAQDARFSYHQNSQSCYLFVNGEEFTCPPTLAETLCNQTSFQLTALDAAGDNNQRELLCHLLDQGWLELDED
ncbi:cupin domain-containing protein [Gilvimarinus chinensis]|uniref:cupin domain-containing protein n=1 Tax=Gilvimarinus chinensis TaxID=396005 RepID=UPI00037326FA|nr:cupin domain-containing protein [Gilvimarinus chinensis]